MRRRGVSRPCVDRGRARRSRAGERRPLDFFAHRFVPLADESLAEHTPPGFVVDLA